MKKKYPIKILGGLILGGVYPDIPPPRRYAPDSIGFVMRITVGIVVEK